MLLLTLKSAYRTSVSSPEWHPTYVVQPVGCLMPLLSFFFFFSWVSEWLCVCVCVSTTVLLVSCYRGWGCVQEWAPLLPRWQDWPQRVNVHYHMKPKCQAHPPLRNSHLSLSPCVSRTWMLTYARKHTHLLSLDQCDTHKHPQQAFFFYF